MIHDNLNEQGSAPSQGASAPKMDNSVLYRNIQKALAIRSRKSQSNLDWLFEQMHPYFFITMRGEIEGLITLVTNLHNVPNHRQITLIDQEKKFMVARQDIAGSLYDTLKGLQERAISYAELTHSYSPIPGTDKCLEIQRYEFDRKSSDQINQASRPDNIPRKIKTDILNAMKRFYPSYDFKAFDKEMALLFINNEHYVATSPSERVARILWLCQQCEMHDGLYMDEESTLDVKGRRESRILFGVGNPKDTGLMTQVSEVFQRLHIGVRRFYVLHIASELHRYFLGTFYVTPQMASPIEKGSALFRDLKAELYNTQILSTARTTYKQFVINRVMTGEEASLTNAFVAFCHTTLAHNQPDRFDLEVIKSALITDPEMTLMLIRVFKTRFDPEKKDRQKEYQRLFKKAEQAIANYNTGHRYLDEVRKSVFTTCLLFIRYTLKTNFFVLEKHALAFRLDPEYLDRLTPEFTTDLPQDRPFRVTFFFGRHGVGYHVGFSDIARGGWRTIICRTEDEYTTNSNTLFREVFVLAHTQHLKNKDIYEGGSKMTVVLNAQGVDSPAEIKQRMNKLQYGLVNAFLDIFATKDGNAINPLVTDYYRQEEPIELGPDENLHTEMIEYMARQSVKRDYVLGLGIISSKEVGINHKAYGVTSRGVIKFAEIAMRERGINIYKDPFSVKVTGGTNGDVAGNCLRLLIERCPQVRVKSIVAGSGALYDPKGADNHELASLVLRRDVVDFAPEVLNPGGYLLFHRERRLDGIRELYKKVIRTESGVETKWITTDELHKEFDDLMFDVSCDLFLPCGGRPETIDMTNWQQLFDTSGKPTAVVIVEGANSFITPDAREKIQKQGVVVLRDASANKCGVISSSYEIIANLLMTEKEFMKNKDAYINDVLRILEKRAEQEANLLFRRHRESKGEKLYTDISAAVSREINGHYARLFAFFQERCELCDQQLFKRVLLNHLPAFIRENTKYRRRVNTLPSKIKYAILATEIATTIVYEGGWETDFQTNLKNFVKNKF